MRATPGAQRSEECRARFEALLRALGDARVARAGERVDEHSARQVQNRAEAAAAVGPRAEGAQSSGGGSAAA
eukprot:8751336-Alexandrium_andersonii.AAC.1